MNDISKRVAFFLDVYISRMGGANPGILLGDFI